MTAPPPAPAAKTESPNARLRRQGPAFPANPPGQVAVDGAPASESSAVALLKSQDAAKLALGSRFKSRAEPQADAKPQLVASAGTSAQPPAGVANGVSEPRYALAGQPAPATSLPTGPAVPSAVALTPPPANLALADEPAKRVGSLSRQSVAAPAPVAERPAQLTVTIRRTGHAFKSLAAAAPANRRSQSPIAADSLSNAAAEPSQQARAFAVAQRFVQIAPEAKAKDGLTDRGAAAHPVLASFQVEQAGQVLRIVDGDGSVYTGSLQLAKATQRLRAAKAETPAPAWPPGRRRGRSNKRPPSASIQTGWPSEATPSASPARTKAFKRKWCSPATC